MIVLGSFIFNNGIIRITFRDAKKADTFFEAFLHTTYYEVFLFGIDIENYLNIPQNAVDLTLASF